MNAKKAITQAYNSMCQQVSPTFDTNTVNTIDDLLQVLSNNYCFVVTKQTEDIAHRKTKDYIKQWVLHGFRGGPSGFYEVNQILTNGTTINPKKFEVDTDELNKIIQIWEIS